MMKYANYESAASISAQPLVKMWFERILEDCTNEVKSRVKLVGGRTRLLVWNVTHYLGITSTSGVSSQTCKLFEKYLHVEVKRQIEEWKREGIVNSHSWEAYKDLMAYKFPLLVASCCQLAAKMNNVAVQLTAGHVKSVLAANGNVYSLKDVIESELHVYRTIQYRIPLWTSLDILLLLAKEVDYVSNNFVELAAVMDFAEYRKKTISRSVLMWAYWTDNSPNSDNDSVICTLHLCAGVLLAVHCRGRGRASPPLERLALLTRATPVYLNRVCVVLTDQIDNHCIKKEIHQKR